MVSSFASPRKPMYVLLKFVHLAAAVIWLGGMAVVLFALRPATAAILPPPQRLELLAAVLARFFILVWACIALLLGSGFYMLLTVGMKTAPVSWHLMLGIGLAMCLIFGHLYFVPFRRLKAAVSASDWPAGARQAGQIATLVILNFCLGWLAVAGIFLLS